MATALSRSYLLVPVVALALAGCTTVPTTEDPVYLKLTDLEARHPVDSQRFPIGLASERPNRIRLWRRFHVGGLNPRDIRKVRVRMDARPVPIPTGLDSNHGSDVVAMAG